MRQRSFVNSQLNGFKYCYLTQVILFNINGYKSSKGLNSFIWPIDGLQQVLSFWVRVDLGVMTVKEYSTFSKDLELEPHHQMQFSIISRTLLWEGYFSAEMQSVYSTALPIQNSVNAIDCDILVNHFEFQTHYDVHFQTNAPWKKNEPPYHSN